MHPPFISWFTGIDMDIQKEIVAVLFFVFVVIRLFYGRGKDERKRFHHSRELLLTAIFTCTLIASFLTYFSQPSPVFPLQYPLWIIFLGCFLGVCGNILLLWVHHCLGTNFSPHLEIRSDHKLIQNGPYRYIRHPMYTSGYLFLLGCGIISQDGLLLFPPIFTFSILLFFRLRDEEVMLEEKFGEDWLMYTKTTAKIIPKIW